MEKEVLEFAIQRLRILMKDVEKEIEKRKAETKWRNFVDEGVIIKEKLIQKLEALIAQLNAELEDVLLKEKIKDAKEVKEESEFFDL